MDKDSRRARLNEFVKTERLKLIGFVRRLIDDASDRDGEDIVQDVLLNIFNLSDFSIPMENLAAYIYQSLRNRVLDILKKKKIDTVSYNEYFIDNSSSLENYLYDKRYNTEIEFEKNNASEMIFAIIDSLEDDYRDIIYLTEFEGRSFRELSEELNVPIGTLLSRKSRAVEKIRKKLQESNL